MNNKTSQPCVFLTSNQYKPNIGGIENSLYHLGQEYKNLGYQVVIIASDLNPENKELCEFEDEDGVTIYRYKAKQGSGFLGFAKHALNAIRLYKKLLKLYQPQVTICRFHFNLVLLKVVGYKNIVYLVPGVVENETRASLQIQNSVIGLVKSKLSFALHKTMQKLAFSFTDKLFVFSENMRDQIRRINRTKPIYICKPGVSLARFTILKRSEKLIRRESLGIKTAGPVFFCIGRFVKAKGFDTAIKALHSLNDSSAQLWLLGEGPEEAELKKLSHELQVSEQIKFLGRQSCPEKYYQAADFFIMSSTYEPLGQTILEALACGLPIIAAKSSTSIITATSEMLSETKNILLEEYSPTAFSAAMQNYISLSELAYESFQVENRDLAESKFSWLKLAKELATYD
ncbi:glycosyltransferase family 4 protein [Pseudoalteromonas sp. JBTF-M23]|uniref:Glycosyltransferase family 4 protein n=1 Tax=Pseudoalteromonas caenipelagi TaxID=2726988 RepID=A0A849VF53_9GAMM|nr:glycosyltransferase family 4 protein [Pseudoalteromonas caenipelagi]NOU51795.1 glycosyltransferase family 4 protein [Pseudoalteromonas caenipelagi]